ncbi:hypothetical protein DUI87_22875 [Hirundo rustica rustica]|uniref:TNF receptor-associated factor n=1 Tax=Hirundo rustica rustica TaxID=333673 RepID=A0A3M0JGK1_HIRRU|nr:hypothetical protein DUI87_22875 [Hirundo rustica rustica]
MASACSAAAKEESCSVGSGAGNPPGSFAEETQGYDVEFDPPLESKYECPICLMALREAVQTPCGHRFCKGCIVKSIRDAGHKCPVDNEILLENQLFPDNFAKREILSLMVKCPNKGCSMKMELRHLEDHQLQCDFSTVECPQCQGTFPKNHLKEHVTQECPRRQVCCPNCATSMAYEDKEMQRNELARHMQEFTQVHMRMMAQSFQNISVTAANPVPFLNGLHFEPALFSHVSHAAYDCNPEVENFKETIQQLEGRLVRQDHQIRELIAKMETQNTHMAELKRTIRNLEGRVTELEAEQCHGIYIWKIENFSGLQKAQEEERPVVMHSPGFYTGKPGYKLCLRLHIQLPSAQRCANYISLFVHTMQGEYDSYLPWPFQGTIRLSILDQSEGPERQNHEEVMEAKPELLAFQRPTIHRNPKGFGYVTFMHLQNLKQRTFIKDDTLLVRCEVQTRLDLNSVRREGFQARSTDGAM